MSVHSKEEYLNKRTKALEEGLEPMLPDWRDIQALALPERGKYLSGRSETDLREERKRSRKRQLDMVPELSMKTMGAGMMNGVTSRSRPWFEFGIRDRDLMEFRPVREWLEAATEIVRDQMAASNIYEMFRAMYLELAGFGVFGGLLLDDPFTNMRARAYTAGEYYLGLDEDWDVDTFCIDTYLTADQMISEYGLDNVSTRVKNMYENGNGHKLIRVINLIEPNDDRYDYTDPLGRPYRSIHFEYGMPEKDKVLREAAYSDFRGITPRWTPVSNNPYGGSIGSMLLGEYRGLMKMHQLKFMGVEKSIDPVINTGGPDAYVGSLPGGMAWPGKDATGRDNVMRPVHVPNVDLSGITEAINDTRAAIREGSFNNLFLLITGSNDAQKTAREIAERHEEKLTLLGPVFDSLDREALRPVTLNYFNNALRRNMLPEPPEELDGVEVQPEYISILAQAQKAAGIANIEQYAGFGLNLASVKPEVTDGIDFDELLREYGEKVGVSASIQVPQEAIDAVRQAREARMAAMQNVEMAQGMAGAAQSAASAPMGENTVLDNLLGGLSGQQQQ